MINKRIGKRFTPALVARFDALCEQFPTSDACLTALLDAHAASQAQPQAQAQVHELHTPYDILRVLECTEEQWELIERAMETTSFPWKAMFRVALLAEAKNRFTYAERLATVDLSDAQARQHVRGAGYARCREILDQVIAANNTATGPEGRRYIAAKLISKLGGVSPAMAIKFCEVCADEIREHNHRMGFDTAEAGRRHNQWVYGKSHSAQPCT